MLHEIGQVVAKLIPVRGTADAIKLASGERRRERRIASNDLVGVKWSSPSGELERQVATVKDYSERGFFVVIDTPIPDESVISVFSISSKFWSNKDSVPILAAVVRHVEHRDDGYWVGLEVVEDEQRQSTRKPVRGAAFLCWTSSSGQPRKSFASVLDASEGGLQVELAIELKIGQELTVSGGRSNAFAASAAVRHWRKNAFGSAFSFWPNLGTASSQTDHREGALARISHQASRESARSLAAESVGMQSISDNDLDGLSIA